MWNTFGLMFYMAITEIPMLSKVMNSGTVIPINFYNILDGIFRHSYYFTFWYMQDLIVLTLFIASLLVLGLRSRFITAFYWWKWCFGIC